MKKIMILAALAAFTLTSCVGVLNQEPLSSDVVGGDSYTNPTYRLGQLAKIYGSFNITGSDGAGSTDIAVGDAGASEFIRAWWSINTLTTDEAKCVWGDAWVKEIVTNTWTATKNDAIYATYVRGIMTVTLANNYLRSTDDSDPEIAIERAEVRVIRALAYWMLLDSFGNPPFTTDADPMGAVKPQQTTAPVLYAWLKTELEELVSEESHLKAVHTQTYPRLDKGAAYGLLSRLLINHKTYLGTEDKEVYQQAMDAAEQVIGKYTLAPEYRELFMGDNGENGAQCEAILPLLQDGITTTSWGTSLFLMASTFKDDMTIVGAATNNVAGQAWAGNRCRPEFVKKFFPNSEPPTVDSWEMVKAAGDDRALLWGKDRNLNIETLADVGDFTQGFSVAKFTNYTSNGAATHASGFPDTDFFLMRAAEAWLTFAEATARQNGGTATGAAADAINDIRERANTTTKSSYTMNEILDEWAREFYYEGRRRIDLIRHGKFGGSSDYKWQWKGGVQTGTNFASHLNIYALPDWDLSANPNLKQNPGYAE